MLVFLKDPSNGVNPAGARELHAVHGRGSETLFHDRVTAAAWRFKPYHAGGLAERAHISSGWLPSRRKPRLRLEDRGGSWLQHELRREIILRARIYVAVAMLITRQAIIADSSRLP